MKNCRVSREPFSEIDCGQQRVLSDCCSFRPVSRRCDRNSSLVVLVPPAHTACQARSRVSHNSSVTLIARSLLRGSPDLGLDIVSLLIKRFKPDFFYPYINILEKKDVLSRLNETHKNRKIRNKNTLTRKGGEMNIRFNRNGTCIPDGRLNAKGERDEYKI